MESETEIIIDEPIKNIEVIMPTESTIELRHIRSVIGEKEDLPSLSSRVSLVSRIRSLITKFFGVPQLIHLQGSLDINKTLTLAAGENNPGDIFSDGTYLYVGLQTNPGKVVKIDLKTFTSVSTLTFDVGETSVKSLVSDGTYLYAGLDTSAAGGTTAGKVVRINLNNFTKKDTLTFDAGEDNVSSLFLDGTYLYAGLQTTPAKVVRVNINTFTKTSTLSLTGNLVQSLYSDTCYLYASVNSTVTISRINLISFTETSTLTLSLPISSPPTSVTKLFCDGLYLYVLSNTDLTSYCTKIDIETFTELQYLDVSPAYCIFSDGTYLYIGALSYGILKVNISTFKIEAGIPSTESSGPGTLYTDGAYLYAGLIASPGKITRSYIIPSNDVHQRRIDTIKECTQAVVSATTSLGLATTLVDTARTESNDYWNNMTVLILGGAYKGQSRRISDFDLATNTITVSPAFNGAIASGVRYAILPDVATGATSTLTQADILSDATPFAGADIVIIKADTQTIEDSTLKTAPTVGSLASYIASGGVALGTALPNSKSLYDVIALDRLDNGTYGLSAIETLVDDLETRLTAVRAGYMDNLSAGAVAQASVATDTRLAELDAANLPADIDTIKGYTNNLVATVTNGTYTHANNTNEQDLLIFAAATQDINLYLDMVNITQTSTIREYIEVDGATYRQLSAKVFPTDFDTSTKSISLSFKQPNRDYKITFQSSIAEGSAKDILYSYRTESRS